MRRLLSIAAALLSALVFASCGGSSAPKAASAKDLAGVISAKGLGCADYAAKSVTAAPGVPSIDAGSCTVGGKQLNLAVYRTQKDRDRGTIESLKGCISTRAFNPKSPLTYNMLKGPAWTILSADQAETARVADALHTDVVKVAC